MRRRAIWAALVVVVALLTRVEPLRSATSYYFSDCATGGTGTQSDPFCLDPNSDGTNESFEILFDGTGTEAAAGDSIILCCGGTDGCGDVTTSCTYALEGHTCPGQQDNPSCVVDLDLGGTSGAWIVIDEYPGDTGVVLSGDSNQDGTYDSASEPEYFLINREVTESALNGFGFVRFKNLTIEKFAGRTFYIVRTNEKDWEFDGVTMRYLGAGNLGAAGAFDDAYYGEDGASPTTNGHFNVGCDRTVVNSDQESWNAFNWGGNSGSNFTFQGGSVYQSCVTVMRSNGNCFDVSDNADGVGCAAGGTIKFLNSTFYSVTALQNGHQSTGWTWDGNTAYDFIAGIGIEEQSHFMTVTDNNLSARGIYQTSSNGLCFYGIKVADGDNPGECTTTAGATQCATHNVTIARNVVWSKGSGSNAYLYGGIVVQASNASTTNSGAGDYLVENNMVWGTQHDNGCSLTADVFRPMEAPIAILTVEPTILRNNTAFSNECAVYVEDGGAADFGGTGTVTHTVINNAFDTATETGTVLQTGAQAAGSTITNNMLYRAGGAVVVANVNGTTYTCANPIVGLGGGNTNKCADVTYLVDTGGQDTWNLHLQSGDTVCKDAGTSGAADDIDGTARPQGGATDIGADELVSGGGGGRRRILTPGP